MKSDQADIPSAVLADDMLSGAEQIAVFLYGNRAKRRRIYHLHETTDILIFSVGRILHARRSRLMAWIERNEKSGEAAAC